MKELPDNPVYLTVSNKIHNIPVLSVHGVDGLVRQLIKLPPHLVVVPMAWELWLNNCKILIEYFKVISLDSPNFVLIIYYISQLSISIAK